MNKIKDILFTIVLFIVCLVLVQIWNRLDNNDKNMKELVAYAQRNERRVISLASDIAFTDLKLSHIPASPLRIQDMTKVSSRYGYRVNPIKKKIIADSTKVKNDSMQFHLSVDFNVPWGTPVFADADGFISMEKYDGGYGNTIEINHDWNGWISKYHHLSSFQVFLGQRVRQNDLIALSGQTGTVTGPHVDYSVTYNGKNINPEKLISLLN
jgi:murein DD-endopeptidase MepM/ murein hydrolase activator NlpD